ncbi:MAG: Na+:solute symporter [Saprospiraceae bacterium]|nr:Na+:solute symporter [Saprospiraceae bacterium]
MTGLDWGILLAFLAVTLIIGLWSSRRAGENAEEFFLSGRQMPWWLLGISIVATTFSADTPNLVTNIVRQHGVSGNWLWWAFLLTGMLTVFVYARLWRRSGVLTDLEFYEIRYGGRPAAFLRGFRAVYLGVVFNVIIMATVMLAGIKIGGVLLGWSPLQTVLIAGSVTLIYSALGGLRGVLWTDFLMFFMAMAGAIAAAVIALQHPAVGGLTGLVNHFSGTHTLDLIPDLNDPSVYIPLLLIPIAVQWWSVWYPGAEPGGGGYAAQRMLAAKDEQNALGAVLLFNIAHYALRPWPWILVALASMILYPDLASLQAAFPHLDAQVVQDDLAYPAMLMLLPAGLLGLVATSLIAAFMSTISTHLNWGASYLVNDLWVRYIRPEALPAEQVRIGRWSTLILMVLAILVSLLLSSALEAFGILLQIGAGTGLIYILRWFWWRINAWTEIAGMVISFLVALYFAFVHTRLGLEAIPGHVQLVIGVLITTIGWILVTFMTSPEPQAVLSRFYSLIRPASIGWKPVIKAGLISQTLQVDQVNAGKLPMQILAMVVGCFLVYSVLFMIGYWLYGQLDKALPALAASVLLGWVMVILVKKIQKTSY